MIQSAWTIAGETVPLRSIQCRADCRWTARAGMRKNLASGRAEDGFRSTLFRAACIRVGQAAASRDVDRAHFNFAVFGPDNSPFGTVMSWFYSA